MEFLVPREPASTWSHLIGLLLAVAGTVILWRRSGGGGRGKRLSLLVFGLSMAFCYASSTLYHGVRVSEDRLGWYDRLDHVGIFLLIAGTYTPLAWNLLSGRWQWGTLGAVWMIAATASSLLVVGRQPAGTGHDRIVPGDGWASIACYAELARVVSHRALGLLVVGGLFYSVGAVLNVLLWPPLWPGIFGVHDLFHLFVLAGTLSHYRLILQVVVPFERRDVALEPHGGDTHGRMV